MLVPIEALPHIKCVSCSKYLSYFPIHISQTSQRPICGRCFEHLADSENPMRDATYESIAQFLKFPCMYDSEGCVEQLLPVEVPLHEKNCPYRTTSCALDCVWQGTLNELLNHIEDLHANALLRNGEFELDVLDSYETNTFLMYNDEIFHFKRKFDISKKVMLCSVHCYRMLESVTQYYYEITIYNGARNLSKKFPMKSADSHLSENITEVDVDKITTTLNDPSIMIGLVRIFTLDDQNNSEKPPKKENSEIKKEMLAELECPVCFEYIIPPIYQCITGHSICGNCKIKVAQCPTCNKDIKETQNFTLEKLAFMLVYPCRFADYGCDFEAKPGLVKQHQKYCLHGPQVCPLKDYEKCGWKNAAKEMYAHITKVHHDSVLEIDNLCVFFDNKYFEREDTECYIKKFSNVLFKLNYRYWQNCFYWSVQLIGPPEEAKKYKFEIDIIDSTNCNQKLFVRSFCAALTEKQETFSQRGEYVFLKLEQLTPFITDQLNYFIRIIK